MKKLVTFILLLTGVMVWANSRPASPGKENLKGTWEYKAPDAPYEYNTGKIVFEEVDGEIRITVKFRNGAIIKAQDAKIGDDSFSFKVEVEYEPVKVSGKIAGNRITGQANSSQGVINITAERPEVKTN